MAQSRVLYLLFFLSVLLSTVCGKEESKEFKIVPGSDGVVSIALDTPPIASSTCTFEWHSNGATPEMWFMKITGDQSSGDLECVIERYGNERTYLMFTKFKTTLGTAPVVDASVHGNEGPMGEDEAIIDDACVRNHHEWEGGEIRSIILKSAVEY